MCLRSAHETTQSLLQDGASLGRRYLGSLQCMLGSFAHMAWDQQVPVVAALVLFWLVPLLYVLTHEAQSVLAWTSLAYVITHALMHFTRQSNREARVSAMRETSARALCARSLVTFTFCLPPACCPELPLSDCLTIGRFAHAPMLFALWMNTGQ